MLEEFVGKDNIMYQIQSSNGVKKYKSSKETSRKYKIVILVDENSASASEIMAASMKENYGARQHMVKVQFKQQKIYQMEL